MISLSLVLLAVAILLWSRAGAARARLAAVVPAPVMSARLWSARPERLLPSVFALSVGLLAAVLCGGPTGALAGGFATVVAWLVIRRLLRRAPAGAAGDPLILAAGWDLLAACLRAGLPVPTAVYAVSEGLPGRARSALRATADLLSLGADPVAAWEPAIACAETAGLARGARRTARSGTALAGVATTLAANIRESVSDTAEAKAQRAGVLISGPLGLCFLPAFICLGLVPVVIGLAAQLSIHP